MSPSPESARELGERLESRQAMVGVIGLGYVGLPLALTFCEAGFRVMGFDVDPAKVESLDQAESYIGHIESARLGAAIDSGRFEASGDFERLGQPDALLICVPTPLSEDRQPDLGYVKATTKAIARSLRPGQLIVLESTTYPGTTAEVLLPLLEAGGLDLGVDFFLAYSPERESPGKGDFTTATIPKVVGGFDDASGDLAEALYGAIVSQVVRVSSTAVAEATKLTENIFRAVNIALVNELKMVYDKLGIDIWEVLDAAETKPFGFMRFNPGPGWGGHCIPIDPFYLSWRARQFGENPRFIELAGEVNVAMPGWVIGKLEGALAERAVGLAGAKVLILGLAYKPDVEDPRESPTFDLIDRLLAAGAEVSYHDPYVPVAPKMRSWPDLPTLESVPLTAKTLRGVNAVILATDHSNVDYQLVAAEAPILVDTRGVVKQAAGILIQA